MTKYKQPSRFKKLKLPANRNARIRLGLFVAAFAMIGAYLIFASFAAYFDANGEVTQYNDINNARAQNGRARLGYSACLSNQARRWAQYLSQTGLRDPSQSELQNQAFACYPNKGQGYIASENQGDGGSVDQLFNTMMNEANQPDCYAYANHRTNILCSKETTVGSGVYVDNNGTVWVAQLFVGCPGCNGDGTAPATYSPPPYQNHWHAFEPLGGAVSSGSSAISWGSGHVDDYVRGTDNQIWHKYYLNNAWSTWVPVPGSSTANLNGDPAAVAWAPGRIDLFATDRNGHLRHTFFANNNWTGTWEDLGGQITSSPTVTSWGSRLDVFARGTDSGLWHRWFYNGVWSGWEGLGGQLYDAPGAYAWGNGRIDVFAAGTNSAHSLWHIFYNGGWSGWENLGGNLYNRPAVSSRGSGRLDIFVRGTDNHLWHKWYEGSNNAWYGWENLGGTLTGSPGSASWDSTKIDVFVPGTDAQVWHTWWP